jgi:hypothetical protein
MGAAVTVGHRPIARLLETSRVLLIIAGIATVIWGLFVLILSRIPSWRPATTLVVIANLLVSGTLFTLALTNPSDGRLALLMGIGIQVFAFAALQAHALWSRFGR